MTKKEIKNILISMRTYENEAIVNEWLGKIDMKDDLNIEQVCIELGNNEEKIRRFLEEDIAQKQVKKSNEKYPINDIFTYGISSNCIHLHLPIDLHKFKKGFFNTMNFVNLYLLDAIDKIKDLKDSGFYRFQDTDTIYMISPIMIKKEIQFLEGLDFTTNLYSKNQLNNEEFVKENQEAQKAVWIFGKDKNIGTASIGFDIINSKEWQEKKKKTIEEFREKGIVMNEKEREIDNENRN